jgi:hypothetical protein
MDIGWSIRFPIDIPDHVQHRVLKVRYIRDREGRELMDAGLTIRHPMRIDLFCDGF